MGGGGGGGGAGEHVVPIFSKKSDLCLPPPISSHYSAVPELPIFSLFELSTHHVDIFVQSIEVLQFSQTQFKLGGAGVLDPNGGRVMLQVRRSMLRCRQNVRSCRELSLQHTR